MRIYKFLKKEFAIKSLRERRLMISRVSGLNDPFEFFPFAIHKKGQRMALDMTIGELNGTTGVMCFSSTWNNPVMWSHYADQHRGICLGFDIPDKYRKKIKYVAKRQPFSSFEGKSEKTKLKEMDRLLFTKFKDWRYEKEVRISVRLDKDTEEKGLYFKEWDEKLKLVEVIVGARSVTCRREIERELTGYAETVKLIRAAASAVHFEVVADSDALGNHDDLRYFLKRDDTIHPVEFYK
jgi:hypothetical protein